MIESFAEKPVGVPEQVFARFLTDLAAQGFEGELIERLKKILMEDQSVTEKTVRNAIFPEGVSL